MDNKKYYWIKLKTDFFNREDIDFLLSRKNGAEYVVLYQMLCLNTVNNDGRLECKIGEYLVPFNVDKIVRDTKFFDFNTVSVALELYIKLGLIYEEKDGVFKISKYEEIVGSESSSAQRVREWRKNKALQCNNDVTVDVTTSVTNDVTDNVTQENRDKSIENRDIDIRDKNIVNNNHFERELKKEFEEIWKLYPNKKSKKDALRHYINSRRKGTTFNEVLNGVKAYNEFIKNNKVDIQYIKHGSTWFHQECWNDEYPKRMNRTLKDISMAEIDNAIWLSKNGEI